MEAFLSIVGSIASIFGAIWALKEAENAARSADAAREMADRRNLAEVGGSVVCRLHSDMTIKRKI
jgi:hypothetical protein